jgi:hypothetical protein
MQHRAGWDPMTRSQRFGRGVKLRAQPSGGHGPAPLTPSTRQPRPLSGLLFRYSMNVTFYPFLSGVLSHSSTEQPFKRHSQRCGGGSGGACDRLRSSKATPGINTRLRHELDTPGEALPTRHWDGTGPTFHRAGPITGRQQGACCERSTWSGARVPVNKTSRGQVHAIGMAWTWPIRSVCCPAGYAPAVRFMRRGLLPRRQRSAH